MYFLCLIKNYINQINQIIRSSDQIQVSYLHLH